MKKLFLFLLLIPLACFSQRDEAYVNDLTNYFGVSLKDKGVTNYFIYKPYCVGEIQMFMIDGKMCTSKGTYYQSYVIWNEEGVDYIKKFDNCGSYKTAKLSDTAISDFVANHYPALKDDEVKPYRSSAYTGTPELRKTPSPCFKYYSFHKDDRAFEKQFNDFDISNDSEGENLNYTFNQTLKLIELNQMMNNIIVSNDFVREK